MNVKFNYIIALLSIASISACVVLLTTSTAMAQGKSPHNDGSPGPDYVLTPEGWTHKSCGRVVPDNSFISEDEYGDIVVKDAKGDEIDFVPKCEHEPKFNRIKNAKFAEQDEEDPATPTIFGWIERSDFFAPTNWWGYDWLNRLDGVFTVPSNPTTNGATVFFFNSLMPSSGNAIIQPVLQYGAAANGGGNYWVIASWYVSPSGSYLVSPMKNVSPGDWIWGTIDSSGCTSSGDCSWSITASNFWQTSTLNTAGGSNVFKWAQPAVLEAYNVSSCANLPSNGQIDFGFTNAYQPGPFPNSRIEMATTLLWNTWITSNQPQCGYSVVNFFRGTTLNF